MAQDDYFAQLGLLASAAGLYLAYKNTKASQTTGGTAGALVVSVDRTQGTITDVFNFRGQYSETYGNISALAVSMSVNGVKSIVTQTDALGQFSYSRTFSPGTYQIKFYVRAAETNAFNIVVV